MSEDHEEPRGLGEGAAPAASAPDEEPTLETVSPAEDEEPTLETTTEAALDERTAETVLPTAASPDAPASPRATGWAARLEQMTAARKQRRRRALTLSWLVGVPVLVLVVVGMILLAVYGGRSSGVTPASTTTTVAHQEVRGSGLLLVKDGESLSWVVVLRPWDSGGVVMTVPGIALLESGDSFATLAQMYVTGHREAVAGALAQALDVSLGPTVVVDRADLQSGLNAVGVQLALTGTPTSEQADAEALAQAVRTLVGDYAPDSNTDPWDDLKLEGDTSDFRQALGVDTASMAKNAWTPGGATGTLVQGDGFVYLEPDVDAAKALLGVSSPTAAVSVEIKDGAGIEGAARRAGSLLESAGFVLLPMSYAQGYPQVEKTQIAASPEAAEQARQAQSLLGVGEIVVDQTLSVDHLVVTLGKDFGAGAVAETTTTQ